MRRVLIIAAALAGLAGPALAGDPDYQEGSASHDYGYAGYTPRHESGGYERGYAFGSSSGYGYGGGYGPTGYAYPSRAPGYGYGYGHGYGYGRGQGGRRHGSRRHHCGCYYYDDDYR